MGMEAVFRLWYRITRNLVTTDNLSSMSFVQIRSSTERGVIESLERFYYPRSLPILGIRVCWCKEVRFRMLFSLRDLNFTTDLL